MGGSFLGIAHGSSGKSFIVRLCPPCAYSISQREYSLTRFNHESMSSEIIQKRPRKSALSMLHKACCKETGDEIPSKSKD